MFAPWNHIFCLIKYILYVSDTITIRRNQVFWHAALFHECQQLAVTVFDLYKKSVRQSARWDLTLDSLLRWCAEIPVGRRPLVRGGARAPEAVAQVLLLLAARALSPNYLKRWKSGNLLGGGT